MIEFQKSLIQVGISAFGTGIGILIANVITNQIKYSNNVNDISKNFDLLIKNIHEDLFEIQQDCYLLKEAYLEGKLEEEEDLEINLENITDVYKEEEKQDFLKYVDNIKNKESFIKDDELYKQQLNKLHFFKGKKLEALTQYFRKLKIALNGVRALTYEFFPNNIEEFRYINTKRGIFENADLIEFFMAKIDIAVYYGHHARLLLNKYDKNEKQIDKNKAYKRLNAHTDNIKNQELLKKDFDYILQNYNSDSKNFN